MTPIRTFVLEDDIQFLPIILKQLASIEGLSVVGYSGTIEDAIEKVNVLQPELLLLDIQIGNQTSFELLENLNYYGFQVIFISSYEEYALRAIKKRAIDYLLKPFSETELHQAVTIVIESKVSLKEHYPEGKINESQESLNKITLKTQSEIFFVSPEDIMFCQGEGNYTTFNLQDGTKIVTSTLLKHYENLLGDSGFFRVHKSYLVPLSRIKAFNKASHSIILENEYPIEVSKRKKDELIKLLSAH